MLIRQHGEVMEREILDRWEILAIISTLEDVDNSLDEFGMSHKHPKRTQLRDVIHQLQGKVARMEKLEKLL